MQSLYCSKRVLVAAAGLAVCLIVIPRVGLGGHPHRPHQAQAGCSNCCPQEQGCPGHCHHGYRGHHCNHCNHGGPGLCSHGAGGLHSKHGTIDKRYFLRSQGKSWHSAWYDPAEGRPIALVVPPTAEFQAQYGWGVPSSRVAPIYHQFRRPYPGPGALPGGGGGFMPTPNQPSDTVQFGVNAVRGPW